jgi:hypothetical protein
MSEWISVEDRLPERWERVLVYERNCCNNCNGGTYSIKINCQGNGCFWHEQCFCSEITHWMPLPKVPKENE